MIRVLICDDQTVICDGLEMILSADAEILVVGTAYDGAEAVEKIPHTSPDLVLMDLKMPGMNGIQATRLIRQNYPEIKVLVLTTFGEDEWVYDAIRSGAAGYLLKGTPRADLLKAIKGTIEGKTHVDPEVAGRLFDHIAHDSGQEITTLAQDLSERELEILRLLAKGFTNAEIADRLYLTRGTVRNYVSIILTKLGVEDRTQAALAAVRYGLVKTNDS
ncbi:MAG: response regulator transcription factor [Anaerolineales bacterium]|nr:response regulator transcription factor [Anaerolineales bacterium]